MKIVQRLGLNHLVEFEDDGILRRSWMPIDSELTLENARRGVEAGITEEDLETLGLTVDAAKLLDALHRRGIWNFADVQRLGTKRVQAAVLESLGWAVAQLINLLQMRR